MRIGVDFDGVIIDSENWSKFYADYWSEFELGKHRIRSDTKLQQNCFDWTDKETDYFLKVIFEKITKTCPVVVGVKEIIEKLKQEGNEIHLITKRGYHGQREIDDAKQRLNEIGLSFDAEHFYEFEDKYKVCKKYGIDVMIDDSVEHIRNFINKDIKIIFFQATTKDIKSKNIFYADDWLEVYKTIRNTILQQNNK